MRALTHFGLAALFFIAPALCCCSARLLARQFIGHTPLHAICPACPQPEPAPPSCCHAPKRVAHLSCCQASEASQNDSRNQHQPPATPQPRCDFCVEKSVATPPESGPSLESPPPTGELIPVALLGLTTLPPEHLGLLGGLQSSEQIGVDTRYECLFARHVLRC